MAAVQIGICERTNGRFNVGARRLGLGTFPSAGRLVCYMETDQAIELQEKIASALTTIPRTFIGTTFFPFEIRNLNKISSICKAAVGRVWVYPYTEYIPWLFVPIRARLDCCFLA
jgi:hypothetical protein